MVALKRILTLSVLAVAGCGSTGVKEGPARGDDDDDGQTTAPFSVDCNTFHIGEGLTCDPGVGGAPPTLRVDYDRVVSSEDPRLGDPDEGKFLGTFTPTIAQNGTLASPGGQISGRTGQILYNAASGRIGVRAADEICKTLVFAGQSDKVPSAHACTNEELIRNVHQGLIGEGTTGMTFGSHDYRYSSSDPTNNSFKGSCGNWTYNSADLYRGTRFTVVDSDPKSVAGPGLATEIKFTGDVNCNTALPVACCR